jgi:hypothetical protein
MNDEFANKDFVEAWDRIARTADGQMIYRHLQVIRHGIFAGEGGGALRRFEGRRSLAADLMAHMAKGIEASGGTERPIVYALQKPADVGKRQSARDWLRDNVDADPTDRRAG